MDAGRSVIVVGYAKVPRTSASHAVHEFFSISLRIDPATDTITEADSTAVSGLVRRWLSEQLVGTNFAADIGPVLAGIEANYLSNATGSVKQAISDAWGRYAAHRARG